MGSAKTQSNTTTKNQRNLGELSKKEQELIFHIRNRFRFGEVVIEVRNGEPYRMKRFVEFQTLD